MPGPTRHLFLYAEIKLRKRYRLKAGMTGRGVIVCFLHHNGCYIVYNCKVMLGTQAASLNVSRSVMPGPTRHLFLYAEIKLRKRSRLKAGMTARKFIECRQSLWFGLSVLILIPTLQLIATCAVMPGPTRHLSLRRNKTEEKIPAQGRYDS